MDKSLQNSVVGSDKGVRNDVPLVKSMQKTEVGQNNVDSKSNEKSVDLNGSRTIHSKEQSDVKQLERDG
jgi:hypothetical protein